MLVEALGDSKTEHQVRLEQLFNKNQLLPRIKGEFAESQEMCDYITETCGFDLKFGLSLLAQMVLHKRTNLPTLVGILRHHFDTLQECADALYKAVEMDLVDWNDSLKQFIMVYDIPDDVKTELEMFQFPLPMVVEPREVTSNNGTGYLVADPGSIILKNNHHDEDVCLDHINRVNRFRFVIDDDTAMMVKNEWRNLDKPKEGEDKKDFEKRVRAFEKYDRTAKQVVELLVEEGREFYLTHRYDKRGRVYCQGYHVTYQGATWNKAVIQLAEKEHLTE